MSFQVNNNATHSETPGVDKVGAIVPINSRLRPYSPFSGVGGAHYGYVFCKEFRTDLPFGTKFKLNINDDFICSLGTHNSNKTSYSPKVYVSAYTRYYETNSFLQLTAVDQHFELVPNSTVRIPKGTLFSIGNVETIFKDDTNIVLV